MKHRMLLSVLPWIVGAAVVPRAQAQGLMSFQTNGPGGTTVTTGQAESYMRAGLDWDGTAANVIGGIAVPTVLSPAKVTTWKDGTALHFKFSIPDVTMSNTDPATSTLACGEQVIVQIDKTNSKAADLNNTGANRFFRYDVVVNGGPSAPGAATLTKRVPLNVGALWKWGTTGQATTASVTTPTTAGNKYEFEVTIPLGDVDSPAGEIGVALAIIDDLGHHHIGGGGTTINEASGTAFPMSMGLTTQSDPGLTCGSGTTKKTEDATGNWVKPSTWGTSYSSIANMVPDVTFSQAPTPPLSDAIRIGPCHAQWADIKAVPSLSGWSAFQTDPANSWYEYNPDKPCRMSIWFQPQVNGPGVVTKRFLVVWGRPGIAPQEWYFIGLTNAVPISGSTTPVSFIWDKPGAVGFSDHPCLRVYVLPGTLTPAESTTIAGIDTDVELKAMESTYVATTSSMHAAQMNFANIKAGSCTNSACQPLALRGRDANGRALPRLALAGFAPPLAWLNSASWQRTRADEGQARERDSSNKHVRIIAQAAGVSAAASNRPYVYLEPIGAIGWALPIDAVSEGHVSLKFDVTNPKVAETAIVGGTRIDVPAPPRRILISVKTEAPRGYAAPRVDTRALARYADMTMEPGQTAETQIVVGREGGIVRPGIFGLPWWAWLIFVALVLLLLSVFRRRRNP